MRERGFFPPDESREMRERNELLFSPEQLFEALASKKHLSTVEVAARTAVERNSETYYSLYSDDERQLHIPKIGIGTSESTESSFLEEGVEIDGDEYNKQGRYELLQTHFHVIDGPVIPSEGDLQVHESGVLGGIASVDHKGIISLLLLHGSRHIEPEDIEAYDNIAGPIHDIYSTARKHAQGDLDRAHAVRSRRWETHQTEIIRTLREIGFTTTLIKLAPGETGLEIHRGAKKALINLGTIAALGNEKGE